jgi:LAO/AO transport system kinase
MTNFESVLAGDRLALSRLLTQVENGTQTGRQALDSLFKKTGHAHLVGVTGAPGTGKSCLVSQIALEVRKATSSDQRSVAIVAVDPSSPFNGGAILGDRVRMRELAGDPGVFIRSMASRGALGGLSTATAGMVQVLDAAGFDLILVETVGAGQSEVDIARLAHTTLVVETPGMGDDIQAIKAGILEIADILVINKADLPGVENTERALRTNLEMGYSNGVFPSMMEAGHTVQVPPAPRDQAFTWTPPILKTVAIESKGIPALVEAIWAHHDYLVNSGKLALRDRERLEHDFEDLLVERLKQEWTQHVDPQVRAQTLEQIFSRQLSPGEAVERLVEYQNTID